MLEIESLTRHNVAYFVSLCEELHGLGSFKHIPFELMKTTETVCDAANDPSWYLRISKVEGVYTGLVAGYVTPLFFSRRLMAYESAWYVRPATKFRTKAAVEMMRGLMQWALDEKEAVALQTGDIADINSIAVDALYRQLGFKRAGAIFLYAKEQD